MLKYFVSPSHALLTRGTRKLCNFFLVANLYDTSESRRALNRERGQLGEAIEPGREESSAGRVLIQGK